MDCWNSVVTFISCVIVCQVSYGADTNYLTSVIKDNFSDNRHHLVNPAYKTAAKTFIYEEFKRHGFEAAYHNFTYPDISDQVIFTNVVGILKGANFGTINDKIVALGAHYDTVEQTKGVDDNGAGVAAMLEVARQLGSQNKNGVKRNNTIILLSFDLEEEGYVGSWVFIQQWLNPWLVNNYGQAAMKLSPHGIIVLDTMMEYNTSAHSQVIPNGASQTFHQLFPEAFASMTSDTFRGDFLAMIYRTNADSSLASSLRSSWEAEKRPQFEFESFALPFSDVSALNDTVKDSFGNFFRSDHYNFWVDNIPAIFLTDSANFRGDMIKCYHHACDNLEMMLTDDNINFLGKTADSIARSMNQLSQPINSHTNGSEKGTFDVAIFLVALILSTLMS